ncbi:MAG: GldM family protein [Bacteroidota bacterium]
MLLPKMSVVAAATALLFLCSGFTFMTTSPHFDEQDPIKMSPALFKTQGRLNAVFPNFDFDAQCQIEGFRLVRVSKRTDPAVAENRGGDFNSSTVALVNQAKYGDVYFFEDIRTRCSGDYAARKLNAIVVKIQ